MGKLKPAPPRHLKAQIFVCPKSGSACVLVASTLIRDCGLSWVPEKYPNPETLLAA